MRRGLLGALVALLVLPLLLAGPAYADDEPLRPDPGHPWFGPALDIHADSPSAYAERLGATPSLYTFPVDLPLTDEGVTQLRDFAGEAAEQGAILVLQVEPTVPLDDLTTTDDRAVATLVAGLADDPGVQTLVRFAPEMNGSWRAWGQQPERYVAAFRAMAQAVHAQAPSAAMVWSPVYGSGYPFSRRSGADSEIDLSGSRQVDTLDTNGNGRLDGGDDPYGPYYPGDDAVDWVGLILYRFGQSQGVRRNVVPPADELDLRLEERWGYPSAGRASFYERFSASTDHPLLLETAALHNPAVGGASDLEVERRWWREVLGALPGHPMIGAISWLELSREEPEVADEPVDWGITRTPTLAAAFRSDLVGSTVALGPVTEPRAQPDDASSSTTPRAADLQPAVSGPQPSATAARVAAALLVLTLTAAVLGSRHRRWTYVAEDERDRRIDLLRGALLVATVALHLPVSGPLHDVAAGAGTLGGLETFVLVSGICVGLVYPPLVQRLGHTAAAGRRLRRALVIWLAAMATVVATWVIALVPGLDLDDIGTIGPPGARIDLYAGARRLFDYPPPGWIAQDLLTLRLGSWLVLPLALFVALHLLSPLAAGPLTRGWWWAVLPASWLLYAVGRWSGAEPLPSSSEVVAPVLVWQLLFVHGIALAQHRRAIETGLRRRWGVLLLAAVTVASAVVLATGAAPAGSSPDLPLLRILVVATSLVVSLVVLTTCWRPLSTATGAVLTALGRRPLPVVLAQPVLVLVLAWAVRELPGGREAWAGTLLTLAAGGLLALGAWWSGRPRRRTPQDATG